MGGSPPTLERCSLAFADAMGTTARSEDRARAPVFLAELADALEHGKRIMHGDAYARGVRSSWFSDNVCVSVPHEGWASVSAITQGIGALAATFALRGVFLRGAVTVDLHCQQDTIVFGPGLTAAAKAEKAAFYPRVILLEPACELAAPYADDRVAPLAHDEEDGRVFVDFVQYLDDDLPILASRIVEAISGSSEIDDEEERLKIERQLTWLDHYFRDRTRRSPHAPFRELKVTPNRFRTLSSVR